MYLDHWVRMRLSLPKFLLMQCLLLSIVLFALPVKAEPVIRDVVGLRMIDTQGQIQRLGMNESLSGVAIMFVDPQCSTDSKGYQALHQQVAVAKEHDLSPYVVISSPAVSAQQAVAFAKQYSFDAPVIVDGNAELASRLMPSAMPQTYIVNVEDRQLYVGSGAEFAKAAAAARNNEVYRPKAPTGPKGCEVKSNAFELAAKPTYNRHVRSLVNANCLDCHRDGGVAPFSLKGYQRTKPWAGMMAHVTKERFMPPWKGIASSGHRFRNERVLSDREIELLQRWFKQGAPEGAKDEYLPEPNLNASGWRLGKPDLLLTMEEPFDVPASGDDIYRYFVIKDAIPKDMMIVALDFKPGDASVVHHCNFFLDYEQRAREMDAKDNEPGFQVFGNGFMDYFGSSQGQFPMGAWAPGGEPVKLPEGMGIPVPGGGDFVIEIHYHLNGKKTQDQSQIAVYLAKKPVEKEVTGLFVGTQDVSIPAGDADYWRHFYMDVTNDLDLIDIAAHMHYIGQTVKVVATLPDGSVKPLLMIKDWDIRWQNVYVYRKPVFIPKGSRIDAWYSFDNSKDNPANPFNPPVDMGWGWASDEEMAEIYLTVFPRGGFMGQDWATSKLVYSSLESWQRGAKAKAADIPKDRIFEM